MKKHAENTAPDPAPGSPEGAGMLGLLESAVRYSKESILITDAELDAPGPRIVFVNPAFTAMTGHEASDVLGKTPRILQGARTERDVMKRLRACLERGEPFEGRAFNYRKDGSEFVIEWQVAPIRDPKGKITHFVAIQRDISERDRLEEAARRLAAIVESSSDAIIGKDLGSIVRSWNKAAEKIFGFTASEMIGTSITRIIPKERLAEEAEILRKITSGHAIENFETLRQRKDGSLVPVSVTASPIKDNEGRVVGVSKFARDITWKRLEEVARRASQQQYRTLFDRAPVGILIADPQGIYLDANPAMCTMMGYERQELVGLSASNIVVLDEQEQIGPALRAIKSLPNFSREWRFSRKDGSIFSAGVVATMMPDGNIMAIVQDISDRKRAEQKIAEQASFMDKARDAIIVSDLRGIITYWNKGAERLYGWSSDETVGLDICELLYKNPNPFKEFNERTIATGEWHGELEHIAKDKTDKLIDGRWTLIRDDEGRPKSILAINSDITERKRLEAQFMRAQRMESIGTLASGIAHDLNNILSPIMMSIEMLKGISDEPETTAILETIELSAKRGAGIVRQVLSFARGLDGDKLEVQPKHILNDLRNIVRDTFPRDIDLKFDVAPNIWTIFGDPTQLDQLLLNLCVNARDAMPRGGRLSVAVENIVLDEHYASMNPRVKPGRYVHIAVSDTGTGIPQSIIEKIFEPFFTTKELGKGTGLGLSTALAVVKSHEGIINVYSELGKGSTFRLYLPAANNPSAPAGLQAEEEAIPRGRGEMILVVDDEASVLSITSQTLEAFGYRVLVASDGARALSTYLQNKGEIALILTDVMMPVMDGPALIHALTTLGQSIKVIAASGLDANADMAKLSGTGVSHFLTKPYTARTLLTLVRKVLDGP